MFGPSLQAPDPENEGNTIFQNTQEYSITSHRTEMFRKILFHPMSKKKDPYWLHTEHLEKNNWLLTAAAAPAQDISAAKVQVTDLTNLLHAPVPSHSAYPCTLKMEAAGSSKTWVLFYQTTWRHILEASNLHSHCHQNFQSCQRNRLQTWLPNNPHKVEAQKEAEEDNKNAGLLEGASYDSKGCQTCSFNSPS